VLAPGRYKLVAVLGYRRDALNTAADARPAVPFGGHTYVLVSEPAPIVLT
jgi:hypothetical protein